MEHQDQREIKALQGFQAFQGQRVQKASLVPVVPLVPQAPLEEGSLWTGRTWKDLELFCPEAHRVLLDFQDQRVKMASLVILESQD